MSGNDLHCITGNCYLKKLLPGIASCNLINKLKLVPTKPEISANTRYKTPISLWLVENNQRRTFFIAFKKDAEIPTVKYIKFK